MDNLRTSEEGLGEFSSLITYSLPCLGRIQYNCEQNFTRYSLPITDATYGLDWKGGPFFARERERRSKALPLLILGFIKIRKGSWHVGILDFLRLYAAEGFARSDWRVSKGAAEFKTPL